MCVCKCTSRRETPNTKKERKRINDRKKKIKGSVYAVEKKKKPKHQRKRLWEQMMQKPRERKRDFPDKIVNAV